MFPFHLETKNKGTVFNCARQILFALEILAEDVPPCQKRIVDADFGGQRPPGFDGGKVAVKIRRAKFLR